ncbi:tenascin [Frankliniella occidentalis]|uniref:Tenascin n=1 Tax=Frankliniella occidentalis TaxID=133901 RepID=A0A9C6U841_FRAOC|nr:tenascin [Frankliniella occidentalis]
MTPWSVCACPTERAPLLAPCSVDADCVSKHGRHSACSNYWCECADGAEYDAAFSKSCLLSRTVVGESCKENGDCRVPNTYCKANSCHCSAGFVFSDDAKRCLPVATEADPSCEEARQCVILLRSAAGPSGAAVCLEGKCRCRYDHEFNNGTCVLKKARGMACSNDVECEDLVDGACIQGVCGCATGTVPAVAANKCLPVLRSLGAPCVEQIQCSEGLGDLGLCRGGACACEDGARLGADNRCECEAGRAEDKTRCERPPMHASVAKVAQRQEGGKGGAATPFSSVLTIIAVVSASLWTLSGP